MTIPIPSVAKAIMIILFLLMLPGVSSPVLAAQNDFTLSGKEIIEKLTRLEEGQKGLNRRIDDLSKRIDDQGKRIDDQGKRIDDLRIELKGDISDIRSLMYVILAGIISLIGFVLWDRRTALAPAIKKNKELEEKEEKLEKALKEYALKEPKLAAVLRGLGIL